MTGRLRQAWRGAAAAPALLLMLGGAALAEPVTITVLHTNDVYEIAPKEGRGGLAELATLLRAERADAEHSITTFGGDLISPSVLSGLTQGAQMIELYNLLGTDVAVLGNHEFDFGPEVAAQRIKESDFPWLGTNVLGPDGKPAVGTVDLHMMEVGYRIGFFGLLAPETDVLSSPGPDITIAPLIDTATAAVERLEAEGAEVIVALTHDDIADDRDLARQVEEIDLILGGHDHDPITFYEGGTLIVKAGYDAHYLAAIDLALDRVKRGDEEVVEVVPTAWRYLSTAGVEPDPEIEAVVARYEDQLDQELAVPIGTTTVALDSRRSTVRTPRATLAT